MSLDSTNIKSIFSSVTFWGAVLTLAVTAVPSVSAAFNLTSANTAIVATHIVQVIGFGITVYGRLTATKQVTLTGK